MNKQIILAAVAGSVAAAEPVPCSDPFVAAQVGRVATLDTTIKGFADKKAALEAATKASKATWDAAVKAHDDYKESVKTFVANKAAATKAVSDNAALNKTAGENVTKYEKEVKDINDVIGIAEVGKESLLKLKLVNKDKEIKAMTEEIAYLVT
jgi:hypothetical protein